MLNPDYKEMLLLLKKYDVDFVLIGAYALAFHGIPRSTGDIDFFVKCSVENSKKIFLALIEFGAPVKDIEVNYLSRYGNMFQIGVAPCRIDLITQIDGLRYEEVKFENAMVDGVELKIISREDFIRNKKAAGRLKDLADIESLENGS
jgi:predicted nucleotidyltransferase